MNIDYLANLIESADVSTFRTLASLFLRSIGYPRAFLSDGPYDGAMDFFVHEDPAKGTKTAFQLSIERTWQKKLEAEIKKAKANHPTLTAFIFVSKRRIPHHSITKLNAKFVQSIGLAATHYDNQAIATEFIDKDLVPKLYEALNIRNLPAPPKTLTSPKAEAAAALLLFGTDSGDFRSEMTTNLLLAELAKAEPVSEENFIEGFLQSHNFEPLQRPDVQKILRRSLQSGLISKTDDKVRLSESARVKISGLKNLSAGEFSALKASVESYLQSTPLAAHPTLCTQILEDLLQLSAALWRRFAPHHSRNASSQVDEVYTRLFSSISAIVGQPSTKRTLSTLAELVSKSDFAKKIAAAELYYSLIQTGSSQLVAALGASKGAYVVFDTQVLIPLLCGLLFDRVETHAAYSASQLVDLVRKHKFTAIVPMPYLKEAAAHLVNCCREYQALLLQGEDLSFSANAFASHYSQLRRRNETKDLTFNDYISVFGSPAGSRYKDLSDAFYYPTIERIAARMADLLGRYGIETIGLDKRRFDAVFKRISDLLSEAGHSRANILIEQDARVIGFLESTDIEAGWAKVLCTWDSIHLRLNPSWDSYCVMNPASVTDLLSIVRSDIAHVPMAQLIDYIWAQNEISERLAAKVWDEIVSVEKGNLADGLLLSKAREFRQNFIDTHDLEADFDSGLVATHWLKWKRTAAGASEA
jgi:hypothetical protein